MPRQDHSNRKRLLVGTGVMFAAIIFVVTLGVLQIKGLFETKVLITADFRQVSGLRPGSPVQLEGIEIGLVTGREFISIEYPCNPDTEDRGRFGHDRTDTCDRTLFCAPEGQCAELERYAFTKGLHVSCEIDDQCSDQEICVNKDFRRRYRRVAWNGPTGVCVGYTTDHKRIRVEMAIYDHQLQHLRHDSRATISQNGVLGDQLVQVSAGRDEQIAPGGQLQTVPAMIEELDNIKDRADGVFEKIENTIGGVADLAKAMGDPDTVRNIQAGLANANEVARRTAEGTGTFGGLLNNETYIQDFSETLYDVRTTSASVDHGLHKARDQLQGFDDALGPKVASGREGLAKVAGRLDDIADPNSKTTAHRLLNDPEGHLAGAVASSLATTQRLSKGVTQGEGSLGRLVHDPKAYDDMVMFFQGLQNDWKVQLLVRWARARDTPDPRVQRERAARGTDQ